MNQLITTDVKMTSLDIAGVTGKRHADLLKDIRRMLNKGTIRVEDLCLTTYKDKNNQDRPCYYMTDLLYRSLLNRYRYSAKPRKSNSIYIVSHIGMEGYYKIGVTSNLEGRLNALNNASPLGVRLIYKKEVNEAMKLETHIHNLLSDKNTNLEWFKLSSDNLSKVIGLIERGHIHEFAS